MKILNRSLTKLLTVAASLAVPSWSVADDAQDIFSQLDANKDGVVAADEVPSEKRQLFERLLRAGDKNSDGKISREEFAAATKGREGNREGGERPAGDRPAAERGARPEGRPEGRPDSAQILQRLDKNNDGKISKDEAEGPLRENFDRADANGDGLIDASELNAAIEKMAGRRGEAAGRPGEGRPDPKQLIQRMDANGDGKISKEEAQGPLKENFARIDANGDGVIDMDEFRIAFERMAGRAPEGRRAEGDRKPAEGERRPDGERKPGDGERRPGATERDGRPMPPAGFVPGGPLLMAIDTNHDGEISAEEIVNASVNLAKLDKNGDGKITRDEIFAAMPQRPMGDRPAGDRPPEVRREGERREGDNRRESADLPRREGAPRRDGDAPRREGEANRERERTEK